MVVKFVTMVIKPEKRDLFIDATRENQTNSQLEEGVAIFNFTRQKTTPISSFSMNLTIVKKVWRFI